MEGEEDMKGRCFMNSSLQVEVWKCISNLKVNERKKERERERGWKEERERESFFAHINQEQLELFHTIELISLN